MHQLGLPAFTNAKENKAKKVNGAMPISPAEFPTYPLPAFLEGRCTHSEYVKWLNNKTDTLFKRDKKRGKPYAATSSECQYKEKIHRAIEDGGEYDPYTGEALAWEFIGKWDTSRKHPDGYRKEFALMPTVDHITPDALEFEICSWRINDAKAELDPEEFLALCKSVVEHYGK